MSASRGPEADQAAATGPGVAGVLVAYGLARVGLIALIGALLVLAGTPLVIAVLVALIVALPLSMLLFRGLRDRLDEAMATAQARRGVQRAALRAGLRGDPDPDPADPDPAEPEDADRAAPPPGSPDGLGSPDDLGAPDEPASRDRAQRQPDRGGD